MKAICLTYDRNMPVLRYVIYTYFKYWPDNPFVFHIPWNKEKPTDLIKKYGEDKIKLIQTGSSVKDTMRGLLDGSDKYDNLWWCQDDKYILGFKDVNFIKKCIDSSSEFIAGIKFTKNADFEKGFSGTRTFFSGDIFYRRKNLHQIFQPQIIRYDILKALYINNSFEENFPLSKLYRIMASDLPENIYMLNSLENLISIGETLDQGRLTHNVIQHMTEDGFIIPDLPECNKEMVYM
jgi:hypothetical protein